jgi:hypothetical protein
MPTGRTPASVEEHGVVAHVRAQHTDDRAFLPREAQPALDRGRGKHGGRLTYARLEGVPRALGTAQRINLKDIIRGVRGPPLEGERGDVRRRECGERGEARVQGHHVVANGVRGESVGRAFVRRLPLINGLDVCPGPPPDGSLKCPPAAPDQCVNDSGRIFRRPTLEGARYGPAASGAHPVSFSPCTGSNYPRRFTYC